MFYLDYHVSTQMCHLRDAFMRMFAHYKTSVCTLFWLTKSCLCVTFNIWHHVCHQISHIRSRNDVQLHDITYQPLSVCKFSRTKSCLRTLVWATRRTVMRVHCEKTLVYAVSVYNLPHNFFCLCSTDMNPRSVSTTRRVHARLHTLKDGCLHTLCVLFDLRRHICA